MAVEHRLSRLESSDERSLPQQSDSMNPLNAVSLGSGINRDDLSNHNSPLLSLDRSTSSLSRSYDHLGNNENAALPPGNEPESATNSYLNTGFDMRALWIAGYNPWLPILHPTFLNAAEHASSDDKLLWKAITAATVVRTEIMEHHERISLSTRLQNEVIVEALGNLSLRSVQALLVIANLAYGYGNMTKFGSLISVCKR